MTVSLDDPGVRAKLDIDGSYDRIQGLPEQVLEAWEQSKDFRLPAGYDGVDKVVVVGMGGSAIAADFVQALAFERGGKPITVVRGYTLPGWVDANTLVIACSHSGNTEEILSAFGQALRVPAKKLVITTGGELSDQAAANGIPMLKYSYPNVPRDAIGHGLVRLLVVAGALGIVDITGDRLRSAVQAMQKQREGIEAAAPEERNAAKKTARSLDGAIPFTAGAGFMAPVARRWRTQMDENADAFAAWDELPELNHNLVVGLRHPAELLRSIRAVFIDHESLHPRVRLRYGLTAQLFQKAGIACERLLFPQPDPLAAQLCACHFGDLVSYYLAMLNGTRPVEVDNINWLKDRLAVEE